MTDPRTALARADAQLDASLDRLFALMRVPSISTDPAYSSHCKVAAHQLSDELSALGFAARVAETPGHPMVVAHFDGPASAPRILFYGHYDVQPVDPLPLWRRDPFDPIIEVRDDGSRIIVGRGASDDKGQLRTFVEACRAWIESAGSLPCSVTLLFEGEEESGSTSLAPFLTDHAAELQADFAMICDTLAWDRDTPGLTISLRGMVAGEVTITGPNRDLHSGLYGGPAHNPIQLLSQIIADLKDAEGNVTLPGFYDGVPEITPELRANWDTLGFDSAEFLDGIGQSIVSGERGRDVLEQIWSRPTAEVNGIWGGYTGEGFKTVIPSEAHAKISFRLVGNQDPAAIWRSFEAHVRSQLPGDCSARFETRDTGSPAVSVPTESAALTATQSALEAEWGKSAMIGCGGGIPVVSSIRSILGMDTILVGFALPDDNIHSPNEKYELKSFQKGIRSWVRILGAIGALDGTAAHGDEEIVFPS